MEAQEDERGRCGGGGLTGVNEGSRGVSPRHLLQFSSSLPSGQSSKPLHRNRPMMQWMPLAQGKNVGPHFDLALAAGGERGQTARHQEVKVSDHCLPIPLPLSERVAPPTFTLKPPNASPPPPASDTPPDWKPAGTILRKETAHPAASKVPERPPQSLHQQGSVKTC